MKEISPGGDLYELGIVSKRRYSGTNVHPWEYGGYVSCYWDYPPRGGVTRWNPPHPISGKKDFLNPCCSGKIFVC